MDYHINEVPYGTPVRIVELERKYGRRIDFRVVDTGGAFYWEGYKKIDICNDYDYQTTDETINQQLTLLFKN